MVVPPTGIVAAAKVFVTVGNTAALTTPAVPPTRASATSSEASLLDVGLRIAVFPLATGLLPPWEGCAGKVSVRRLGTGMLQTDETEANSPGNRSITRSWTSAGIGPPVASKLPSW